MFILKKYYGNTNGSEIRNSILSDYLSTIGIFNRSIPYIR